MWPVPNDFSFKEGPEILSPKQWLELDRPDNGVANPAGDLIVVPVNRYSFEDKRNAKFLFLAAIVPSEKTLEIPLPDGGDVFWLDNRAIAHIVEGGKEEDKHISLKAIPIGYESGALSSRDATLIGTFPTSSATNFRYSIKSGILVFSDNVYADGDITAVKKNDEAWENRGDSAYVYDETYERHYANWIGPKRSSMFAVRLEKTQDKWILGSDYVNLLQGTGHHCPVEPFGGLNDFDVSEACAVYTAKDPSLPPAWHTRQNIYLVSLSGNSKPRQLTSGTQGATRNPVFSKLGDKVAWLELDKDGAEAERAKLVIYDIKVNVRFTLTQRWDRSPDETLSFSPDGQTIIFTAGDHARRKIFVMPIPPTPDQSTQDPDLPRGYHTPHMLTRDGTVTGIQPLPNGRLLFTRSSLTAPPEVYVMEGLDRLDVPTPTARAQLIPEVVKITDFVGKRLHGTSMNGGQDFWFEGAEGVQVQGFIVTPPGYKQGDEKKWPALFVLHGGPQSAWFDEWSNNLNMEVLAHQGYIVVAINPTGSTTFGQAFTDAISEDWGGRPLVDLQKGWQYILGKYSEIDPQRAVALGQSWAGYAMHWIEGHPEYGFNFKAQVCQCGIFSPQSMAYSTEELFFPNYEFGGPPWEPKARELLKKYDPSQFVEKWTTPMLLLHGSKDYRVPETESIAAFHALQQLGIQSRLVIFPDEAHLFVGHQNCLKMHWEMFRWFDKAIGSKA